jgi:low affinity Fe/Cu permease
MSDPKLSRLHHVHRRAESIFERLTAAATVLLGSPISFIIAVAVVLFWLLNKQCYQQSWRDSVRDIITGVTFLSLFIIQKSFNRFSAVLHLKVNELVASHESANNAVMNLEEKTEHEITELSKEYAELSKEYEELAEEKTTMNTDIESDKAVI